MNGCEWEPYTKVTSTTDSYECFEMTKTTTTISHKQNVFQEKSNQSTTSVVICWLEKQNLDLGTQKKVMFFGWLPIDHFGWGEGGTRNFKNFFHKDLLG